MQRRRRKKAAPKNVFGSTTQSPQTPRNTRSSQNKPPKGRSRVAPPPSVPGSKTTKKDESPKAPSEKIEKIVEEEVEESIVDSQEEEVEESIVDSQEEEVEDQHIVEDSILEDQILGGMSRKDLGLKNKEIKEKKTPISVEESSGKSLKARQIIQDSMLKASIAAKEEKTRKSTTPKTVVPEPSKKPQKKFRNKNSSYQPASRARRLDRSRHMEYKYEMRGLLIEIGVAEEHRSNLLATIWARGERQTTKEAKDFLDEKHLEGIIDEEQMNSLEKVVDGYTVRR